MEHRSKVSRLLSEAMAEETKESMRDRMRNGFPYVAGALSAMTIAGTSMIAISRFDSNEDMMANAIILASTIGVKVFKDLRREYRTRGKVERLQYRKIKAPEQESIATRGTFE